MSSTPDPSTEPTTSTEGDQVDPDEVDPGEVVPESTDPAEADPDDAEPDDVEPEPTEPVDDEPAGDESGDDESAAAEALDSESVDAGPAEAEPDEAEPVVTKDPPDDAEPVVAKDSPDAAPDVAPDVAPAADPVGQAAVRARLRQVFVRPGRSQAVVGVLLAALGFAAVTQVRSTQLDDTYEGRREEELIEIFNGVAGTSDRTRKEIARLEQDRRDLQVDTSARQAALEQAEARLRTLNMLAGLVPVTGPGLRVTITEEAGRISIDSLLDTIQELRTAGAEAIEFDGAVRLVVSSAFSEVDGVIHLDGEPLRSPYVIEVIGEPHTLHTGLTFPSGPVSTLRNDESADVAIEELDSVDIESVRPLPRAQFATPAEEQ